MGLVFAALGRKYIESQKRGIVAHVSYLESECDRGLQVVSQTRPMDVVAVNFAQSAPRMRQMCERERMWRWACNSPDVLTTKWDERTGELLPTRSYVEAESGSREIPSLLIVRGAERLKRGT